VPLLSVSFLLFVCRPGDVLIGGCTGYLRVRPPTLVSQGKGKGPKPDETFFFLFTM
jgi:hypothetical protein